jgi:hypothetical protein
MRIHESNTGGMASMADKGDEWRTFGVTAAVGFCIFLVLAWYLGVFSAPPEALGWLIGGDYS